ncbi:MAG: ComEC/Rec2 family competence protein [Acidimicrobiales bacterium]
MSEPLRFGALRPLPIAGFTASEAAAAAAGVSVGVAWSTRVPVAMFVCALGVAAWAVAVLMVPSPRRRRLLATSLLTVGLFVSAGDLSAKAMHGLSPATKGEFDGRVRLVSDPERRGAGVSAEVRWQAGRYQVWAFGRAANVLQQAAVGEEVGIRGSVEPLDGPSGWALSRHLVGRIDATVLWRTGDEIGWWWRSTNAVRSHLAQGASGLGPVERALLLGFTVGDDRDLPDDVVDDFRASGLSHLTAVSGQNVVLVLGLVAPLLKRASRHTRSVVLLAVLAWFGLLTRWEPSVVRAVVMAGVAVVSPVPNRPGSRFTLLALVVGALLMIDPLLAWSVGFRLSVAATLGLVLLAGRLEKALPGPASVTQPIAVTAAAQLAVAPVQLATFGPVPMAALPANVAAGPVAAPLMVWGSTAGMVAGWLPVPAANALHVPTRMMAGWVAMVARLGADSAMPHIGWRQLVAALVGIGVFWLSRRVSHRRGRFGADEVEADLPAER